MGMWSTRDVWDDIDSAAWLSQTIDPSKRSSLASLLPPIFDSYVRILYPAELEIDASHVQPVRWADAARAAGGIAHADMQWESLTGSVPPRRQAWTFGPPRVNEVADDLIMSIAEALASYTQQPDSCFFAVWEGNTAIADLANSYPLSGIGGLNYLLLHGSLSRAADTLRGLRPNLWWPADRTWCVATHFDFDSAFFACPLAAGDDLVTNRSLEAWGMSPTADITSNSDTLNSSRR